jgi:uncharacterized protein (DUF433 family)
MSTAESRLDRYIESTADTRGGRPRLVGTRITVSDVVIMHMRLGQSIEEIAAKYELSLAAVYAALAYYHDHRDEIEKNLAADDAVADAFMRNNPSALQATLRSLNRG